jgi:putative spermidine/putrescine transport system substrate-binding protein
VEEMLEVALMADGVPSHALYPLDVDRAFRSLDKIKPYVVKFVKQTQQTISLVQTDEVDFSYTTAARVGGAKLSGIPLAFQTKQPFITPNYLGIPRGSSRKAEAMQLLQYFMKPEIQVALANELPGFGVNSKIAMSMLSPDLKKALPDISNPDTAFANMDWWAGNFETVSKRWNEWMLAK